MHNKALPKLNEVFITLAFYLLVSGLLTSCGYSVSVNDNVVYTPPSLFSDYRIADHNLAKCVEQSIIDQAVTRATDLKQLNCSNAGIESLAGLEVFTGLEEINLAQNNLKYIGQIAYLTELRVLILSKNPLQSAAPLLRLLHLHSLHLADTPELACNDIKQLEQNWADLHVTLIKPAQCH